MHAQLGQIMDEMQKTQLPLLKSQEQKTRCQEQQQATEHAPCPGDPQRGGQTTKGWAGHLSHPCSLTPGRTPTLI